MKRIAWAGLVLSLFGCAERYAIRPTQLSQLNDDFAATTEGGNGRISETRAMIKLETSNGQIIELTPPVVVYIKTSDGREHTFCSPMRARFEAGAVEIKHNCGRPERIDGHAIKKVEIEQW